MCQPDLSRVPLTAESDVSPGSSRATSPSNWNSSNKDETSQRRASSALHPLLSAITGVVLALGAHAFSTWFPQQLWASDVYQPAGYDYDPSLSFFDNSAWTYLTDYGLALVMLVLASNVPHTPSRGLLLVYALSVTAGGLAHQFFCTLESRNALSFRLLWTLCIGSVTGASGFMGTIASDLDGARVPHAVWKAFGVTSTLICALGGMSYQRPACDTFIAGTTQTLSTFYTMAVLSQQTYVSRWVRAMGMFGFIFNAPLLPMYPLLIRYTDWSLARVNTLLHGWLLVAWGLQGLSLGIVFRHSKCKLKSS